MGQCLVRQQRLGGFNLKTGFEAERAQKGTLDTFSKEMDAKILFYPVILMIKIEKCQIWPKVG